MRLGNRKRKIHAEKEAPTDARASKRAFRRSPKRRPAPLHQAPTSFLILSTVVTALCCLAFVAHLYIRFEGIRLGYQTSFARAERARLLVERRELRLELATLKSPGEVEAEARERLGMEMPDHNNIIPINRNRTRVLASGRAR